MNLQSLNTLPNTGEVVKNYGAYIGIIIIIAVIFFLIWRKKIIKMIKNSKLGKTSLEFFT